jgi:hypothetical protein
VKESLQIFNHSNKEYHWKSIYNEFNKWSNDDIFKDAFNEFTPPFRGARPLS